MPNRLDQVRSADELIREGLQARIAKAPAGLYGAFYDAAMDTLRKGAPGLTDVSRSALARSIALKCQHAVKAANQKDAAA